MTLSGSPFDYLVAFFGGILASLTPCVYPLIPVSIGYIGVKAGGSKLQGFFLSFSFVTGIAVIYSILGLVASFTGTIFGSISAYPATYFVVGGIIIIFGLSMLDLFHIRLPQLIRFPQTNNRGYFDAFLLGLGTGLIVSPCLTPILGSILLYLTAKKSILYGTTLLLAFAYGMGLIFIFAGIFSSLLVSLPKSGNWMVYIKKFFALVILVMGFYFIFVGMRRL